MVLIDVNSSCAVIRKQGILTSGMVGATAEFRFSEEWEGLSKTVVFRGGSVTKDILDVNTMAAIPHEVLKAPGVPLEIGVYGINADGTVVIPTVWAKTGIIKPGVNPSGDESTDPTLPVWAQLEAALKKLRTDSVANGDNPLFASLTISDANSEHGAWISPEPYVEHGNSQAAVLEFFGVLGDEPTILRNIVCVEDGDAANKGYVDQAISTAVANLPVYNGEVEEV